MKYIICIAVLAMLMLASCRSHKSTVAASDSYESWTTVQMPVKVRLTAPANVSLSGTLRMVADESVGASMRYLGIMEVGSLYADKDSVFIVAKMMDMYFAESLAGLQARYGIGLSELQNILLGREMLKSRSLPVSITAATAENTAVGPVAPAVDFAATVKKKTVSLTVTNNLDRATWNGPLTIKRPALGRGMTRVSLEQVLALLGSL